MRFVLAAFILGILGTAVGGESASAGIPESENQWVQLPDTLNGHWGNPMVWSPTRKQLLHYTAFDVKAFDAKKGIWKKDYPWPGDKGFGLVSIHDNNRGVSYKGTGLMTPSGVPCPAHTANGLTWDNKRNQMVLVMHGLMATYDPTSKKWAKLDCETDLYGKKVPGAPRVYAPGICYDPLNDEIVMFPHWGVQNSGLKNVTGEVSGHHGTLLYSFKDNCWTRAGDRFAAPKVVAARGQVLKLCKQLSTVLDKLYVARRRPELVNPAEIVTLLKALTQATEEAGKDALLDTSSVATSLTSANDQIQKRALNEALASGSVALRTLRTLLDSNPLGIEPPPRCGTPLIYDPALKGIVMFGGQGALRRCDLSPPKSKGGQPGAYNDTWIYDCATRRWRELPCNTRPPTTVWPQVVRDPVSKKMVLVTGTSRWGGEDGKLTLWTLDPATSTWNDCGTQPVPGKLLPRTNWTGWGYPTFELGLDPLARLLVVTGSVGSYRNLKPINFGLRLNVATLTAKPAPAWKAVPIKPQVIPVADPSWVAKLKALPANTWTSTGKNAAQPHRDWGNAACDPTDGNVYFFGGGHSTYQGREVAIYAVGANQWVFGTGGHNDHTPPVGWGGIHMDFYGCPAASHQRNSYVALDGRMYKDIGAGTMRPRYRNPAMATKGPRSSLFYDVLRGGVWRHPDVAKVNWGAGIPGTYGAVHLAAGDGRVMGFGGELEPYNGRTSIGSVTFASLDIYSNSLTVNKVPKPHPGWVGECRPFCFVPDEGKQGRIFFYEFRKDGGHGTWIYDIAANAFTNLKPHKQPGGLPNTVVYLPDQKAVFAVINNTQQWVYSFKRNTWAPLPLKGAGQIKFQRPYAQTVYSAKYGVLVNLPATKVMRPEVSAIVWPKPN